MLTDVAPEPSVAVLIASALPLTFMMLVFAFLNQAYITMGIRRVAVPWQRRIRWIGLGGAIVGRLIALAFIFFVLRAPVAQVEMVVLIGVAVVLVGLAIHEVFHLLCVDHLEYPEAVGACSPRRAVLAGTCINLLFGVVATLGLALFARHFLVMVTAVVAACVLMVVISDHATRLIERYRAIFVLSMIAILGSCAMAGSFYLQKLLGVVATTTDRAAPDIGGVQWALVFAGGLFLYPRLSAFVRARAETSNAGIPTTELAPRRKKETTNTTASL